MRILFLSNYYPPHSVGGYEQWCQEVAIALNQRGHQLLVITTKMGRAKSEEVPDNGVIVKDVLNLEVELKAGLLKTSVRMAKDRKLFELENLQQVWLEVDKFQPDVAMVWGMWNIPRSVPALVEELLSERVAYYLCDYWPSLPDSYIQKWQERSRTSLMNLPKSILAKPFLAYLKKKPQYELELRNPICVSRKLRDLLVQAGVPIDHAQIIYGGTQVDDFIGVSRINRGNGTLRLLYLGRVRPDKGVHTIIEAVEEALRNDIHVSLDIVGFGIPEYIEGLHQIVNRSNLQSAVSIKPGVPRAQIPDLLSTYHALVFPSVWEEPFARTVLEAMAAGLVVVGTTTGGTGEILVENKTGLTFPVGDAQALSQQIIRLAKDPFLRENLAAAGQKCVEENFSFNRMVNEMESALIRVCKNKLGINARANL